MRKAQPATQPMAATSPQAINPSSWSLANIKAHISAVYNCPQKYVLESVALAVFFLLTCYFGFVNLPGKRVLSERALKPLLEYLVGKYNWIFTTFYSEASKAPYLLDVVGAFILGTANEYRLRARYLKKTAEIAAAQTAGYTAGHAVGQTAGHAVGYTAGHAAGQAANQFAVDAKTVSDCVASAQSNHSTVSSKMGSAIDAIWFCFSRHMPAATAPSATQKDQLKKDILGATSASLSQSVDALFVAYTSGIGPSSQGSAPIVSEFKSDLIKYVTAAISVRNLEVGLALLQTQWQSQTDSVQRAALLGTIEADRKKSDQCASALDVHLIKFTIHLVRLEACAEAEKFRQALDVKDQEIRSLTDKVTTLQKRVASLGESGKDQKSEIKKLQSEINDSAVERRKLEDALNEAKTEIEGLQHGICAAERKSENAVARADASDSKVASLISELKTKEEETATYRADVAKQLKEAAAAKTDSEARHAASEAKHAANEAKLAALMAKIEPFIAEQSNQPPKDDSSGVAQSGLFADKATDHLVDALAPKPH